MDKQSDVQLEILILSRKRWSSRKFFILAYQACTKKEQTVSVTNLDHPSTA